jgi:hypothetical protein
MVLDDCFRWLNDNVGSEKFSQATTATLGSSATAFYFLCLEDALSFLNAFPVLELADGAGHRTNSFADVLGRLCMREIHIGFKRSIAALSVIGNDDRPVSR